jgi:protein SCO1/2
MRRFCTEKSTRRRPWRLRLAALRVLAATLTILGGVAPAIALDYDGALARSEAAVGRSVADYALTDSGGRRVRMTDFRGKPLAVSFVYTGCGQICPTTTKFLDQAVRQAARELGDDAFNVATIGFNLPFDNPAAMDHFAKQQGIDRANWKFLSPDSGSVERLTGDFGFAYAANAGGFDHVAQVTIVDPDGRVVRQLYGETFDPASLTAALRAAATGAPLPLQDVRTLLDRVRILCSVYDPATGLYRLDYALFIEIFAGLTVLGAVAHYLLREWRRHRRPASHRSIA